jgi:hypothetical protein
MLTEGLFLYVSYMFLISRFKTTTCLSDVWHFACVTLKFMDSSLVLYLCVANYFSFVSCCKMLVFLKDISTSVCLINLVIFLIIGLLYVNVVRILFLFLSLI